MSSIMEAQSLIKKGRINKMIFPIEKVVFELVNFGHLASSPRSPSWRSSRSCPSIHALWGLPFIVIMVTMFSTGLGLLISALSVFFRDVMHLWGVLMTAWTYIHAAVLPLRDARGLDAGRSCSSTPCTTTSRSSATS